MATLPDTLGRAIGSGRARAGFSLVPADPPPGAPAYPSWSAIEPACVPSPLYLDKKEPADKRVERLLGIYRAVVKARTGKPCWIGARGATRYRRALVESAEALVKADIPPYAWVLFCCDVWRRYVKGSGDRPPLPWVFSPKRIDRWKGWYGREAASYGGGRMVMGPVLRSLLQRDAAMRCELAGAADAEATSSIVERHFPEGYAQAMRAARLEANELRARLWQQIARGEVLWG